MPKIKFDISNDSEADTFLSLVTRSKLKLLFLMKNWIGIQELMDKTGTSRDALRYHIESLEKNGFIQSRTVKWKTTYKKEYLALPLEVFIHVDRDAGSLPGETAPTQEREDV